LVLLLELLGSTVSSRCAAHVFVFVRV
jgi:hypothetical protein